MPDPSAQQRRQTTRRAGFGWARSIGARIVYGFAVTLCLVVAVAWIARSGVAAIDARIAAIPGASAAALAAEHTVETLQTLRWRIATFARSERAADLAELRAEQARFKTLNADNQRIASLVGKPQLAAPQQAVDGFNATVDRTVALLAERTDSINALNAAGLALTNAASALTNRLAADQNFDQLPAALRLQEAVQASLLDATRFVASRYPLDADAARLEMDRVATAVSPLRSSLVDQAAAQRFLANIDRKLPAFRAGIEALLDNLATLDQAVVTRRTLTAELATHAMGVRDGFVTAEQAGVAEVLDQVASVRARSAWIAAAALAVGMFATWVFGRSVIRPLRSLTLSMRLLAAGDSAVVVKDRGLKDEIGEMARAVEVFRQSAIDRMRLQADRDADAQRANESRRHLIDDVAMAFESHVHDVVEALAARAGALQAASQQLAANAAATNGQALAVAGRSGEASANVEAVAQAAEGLAASIADISHQIGRSADVARKATGEGAQTNATLHGLTDAVVRIGSMTQLIHRIAGQTNLLSLNAAIEAASAGAAGRGFAVVAGEVKSLAQQTRAAAATISAQVTAIQHATASMVQAIGSMGATTREVDQIAAIVAASIQQQSAATTEITRNAQVAAASTREISATVTSVSQSATTTGSAAAQMLAASRTLGEQAETLRRSAASFLTRIKSAA